MPQSEWARARDRRRRPRALCFPSPHRCCVPSPDFMSVQYSKWCGEGPADATYTRRAPNLDDPLHEWTGRDASGPGRCQGVFILVAKMFHDLHHGLRGVNVGLDQHEVAATEMQAEADCIRRGALGRNGGCRGGIKGDTHTRSIIRCFCHPVCCVNVFGRLLVEFS